VRFKGAERPIPGWVGGKKQKRRKQGLSEAKTFVSATVRDSDETLRSFEAESE